MSYLKDTIHIPSPISVPNTHTLIFIPGNPGLISYYHRFLHSLHQNFNISPTSKPHDLSPSHSGKTSASDDSKGVAVYGFSHLGFSVENEGVDSVAESDVKSRSARLYSLQEQIEHACGRIVSYASTLSPSSTPSTAPEKRQKHRIILSGHSVGAYILLQVMARYHAELKKDNKLPFTIEAGVLLFPTVVDIAHSENGLKAGWLLGTSGLGSIAGTAAGWGVWGLGRRRAQGLVAWFMELDGADVDADEKSVAMEQKQAAETTVAFLASEMGVREALYMAADEMRSITADAWDDTIWGAAAPAITESNNAEPSVERPKLFFYFGRSDQWVADKTRDDLIASRAYQPMPADPPQILDGNNTNGDSSNEWIRDSRPRMEIDELGTPHGFCIRHSERIAEVVAGYLRPIL